MHNQELAKEVGVTRSKKTYEVYVAVYNNLSRSVPKRYNTSVQIMKKNVLRQIWVSIPILAVTHLYFKV